jgi:hypothetical protein
VSNAPPRARGALAALSVAAWAWSAAPARAQDRPAPGRAEQGGPDRGQPPLAVRTLAGATRVVAVSTSGATSGGGGGGFVGAAEFAGALGGTAQVRGDRATVAVAGLTVEVTDGLPFARIDGREVPLAVAPRVADGRAQLPLQLVLDALPAASGALRVDPTARQLAVVRPGTPRAAAVAAGAAADDLPPTVTLPSIIGSAPGAGR